MGLFDFFKKSKIYNWQLNEIAALVVILEGLAESDGLYDENEEKNILNIFRLIGENRWDKSVWKKLQSKIKNLNIEKSIKHLKNLSENKKLEVSAFLDIVAKSDGKISADEKLFISKIKYSLMIHHNSSTPFVTSPTPQERILSDKNSVSKESLQEEVISKKHLIKLKHTKQIHKVDDCGSNYSYFKFKPCDLDSHFFGLVFEDYLSYKLFLTCHVYRVFNDGEWHQDFEIYKTNSKKFPYPENDSETDSIDSIIYDTVREIVDPMHFECLEKDYLIDEYIGKTFEIKSSIWNHLKIQ